MNVQLQNVQPGTVLYRFGERVAVEYIGSCGKRDTKHVGRPGLAGCGGAVGEPHFIIRWEDGALSIPLPGSLEMEIAGAQLSLSGAGGA